MLSHTFSILDTPLYMYMYTYVYIYIYIHSYHISISYDMEYDQYRVSQQCPFGKGAGLVYHQTSLPVAFFGLVSSPSFFINQAMGTWDIYATKLHVVAATILKLRLSCHAYDSHTL